MSLKNGKKRDNHLSYQGRNRDGKRIQREILSMDKPFVKYVGSSKETKDYKLIDKKILLFTEHKKQSRYWEQYYLYFYGALKNNRFLNKNINGTYFENDDRFIGDGR